MSPNEKIPVSFVASETKEISKAERDEMVRSLLEQLKKEFPKGTRSNAGAKKIRRKLRALGYYISKQSN